MALTPVNTMLLVRRREYALELYTRPLTSYQFRLERSYQVSVGAVGHRTPAGLYLINTKAKDPEWLMPREEWVPVELQGTIVPGGAPNNPLKARWLGVTDPRGGVGIHGTAATESLGTAASHGCIRMDVPDVIELYERVRKFTPIVIV